MRAEQRQVQFQSALKALGPNPKEEDVLRVATQHMIDPTAIVHWIGNQRIAATNAESNRLHRGVMEELARGRLAEQRRAGDFNYGPPSAASPAPSAQPGSFSLAPPAPTAPRLSSTTGTPPMQIAPGVQAERDVQAANVQNNLTPSGAGPAIPAQTVVPTAPPPSAAPGSKPLPQMPPEIARLPPRGQQAWLLQQAQQSAPARTPESLRDDVFYQIMNGVPRPGSIPTGRAGQGNEYRAQFANELNKVARELKMTPEELATRGRENKSKFVALSSVEKDLAALTPYKEMLDINIDVAINLGKKVADDKTNAAYLNRPLLWVKNNLSNKPDIAEYLAQMHFVEVESARVLTNPRLVGQLTDSAIADMKSVVSGNMTLDSSERVLNRIKADGNNRINAMRMQRERTISEIRGTAPQTRETDTTSIINQADEILRRRR